MILSSRPDSLTNNCHPAPTPLINNCHPERSEGSAVRRKRQTDCRSGNPFLNLLT